MKPLTLIRSYVRAIFERCCGKRPIGVCPRCRTEIYTCFAEHDQDCARSLARRSKIENE